MTQVNKIPPDWGVYDFVKTLSKQKIGRSHQINASEIQSSGQYPVIDQGQDFIAGYSDDSNRVYSPAQPVIIFGDHTRCFKYIDFPFIIGADGTKILLPETKFFNSKFYFFYLLSLCIPSRGYNRHFKLLKEQKVLCPSIEEQANIAHILSKVQSAIETQDKVVKMTTELKKALMQKLFTAGLRGEKQKETEIGKVPRSWGIVPLEQTGEVVYGIQAAVANLTKPIGMKILTNINITFDGEITLTPLRYYPLTKPRHHKTVLRKGDILFNWRSGSKDHVGKTAFFDLDGEFTHSSFILRIRTKKEVSNKYLFYYLTYLRSSGYFRKLQNYSVNAKFNASAVNALPTALPDYGEQLEIAHTLTTIDLKIKDQIKKSSLLKLLFSSMLQHLMTGQIRVKDIRFS